jgi:hypothetical protein
LEIPNFIFSPFYFISFSLFSSFSLFFPAAHLFFCLGHFFLPDQLTLGPGFPLLPPQAHTKVRMKLFPQNANQPEIKIKISKEL